MSQLVFGLDASFSLIDWDAVLASLHSRPRVFVQCLWTGGYANYQRLRQVAEANLRGARERGIIIGGYINASPWYSPEECLERAREAAGSEWEHLSRLAVDVEIEGVRLADVRRLCELCARHRPTCIYTARWFWEGKLRNPRDEWLRDYPLWAAQYDGRADLEIDPFGPDDWRCVGKQFQGTTTVGGAQFDFNIFDFTWWGDDSMALNFSEKVPIYPLPPEAHPELGKLLNDLFWGVVKLAERVGKLEAAQGGACQCPCCRCCSASS